LPQRAHARNALRPCMARSTGLHRRLRSRHRQQPGAWSHEYSQRAVAPACSASWPRLASCVARRPYAERAHARACSAARGCIARDGSGEAAVCVIRLVRPLNSCSKRYLAVPRPPRAAVARAEAAPAARGASGRGGGGARGGSARPGPVRAPTLRAHHALSARSLLGRRCRCLPRHRPLRLQLLAARRAAAGGRRGRRRGLGRGSGRLAGRLGGRLAVSGVKAEHRCAVRRLCAHRRGATRQRERPSAARPACRHNPSNTPSCDRRQPRARGRRAAAHDAAQRQRGSAPFLCRNFAPPAGAAAALQRTLARRVAAAGRAAHALCIARDCMLAAACVSCVLLTSVMGAPLNGRAPPATSAHPSVYLN
jgi:hypothetical protein